jgi:TRAP-type mannitol/chloroaromatic compound transport system permease small subunit
MMPRPVVAFVKTVDALNYRVGRFAMYLIYVLGAVLIGSTLSRLIIGAPFNWALEMSQFILSAYYLLGGAYAWQQGAHVRMDLIYGQWTPARRAMVDAITVIFVIFYLIVLFAGGISSTNYAIVYKQQNYSAWAPMLWPIKAVMTVAIFLMLLQAISSFFKDIAELRGKPIA